MKHAGQGCVYRELAGLALHAIDMRSTCIHVECMSKMIQIRNVPDELHRRLKTRAAQAGMSLTDYLLNEVRKIAEQPTWEEFRARLAQRSPVELSIEPAEIIREMRDRG